MLFPDAGAVADLDHMRMRYRWYACCQDRNSYRHRLYVSDLRGRKHVCNE